MSRLRPCVLAGTLLIATVWSWGSASASTCTVGELTPPNTSWNVFDLTGLTAYQLVDPSQCAACTGGNLVLSQVSWQFRYYSTLCPITFEVAVVRSTGGSCPAPDTTSVISGPFVDVYTASGPAPHFAAITIPGGSCIGGPAFVKVKILNTDGCTPGMLGFFTAECLETCRSYVTAPTINQPLDDSCNLFGSPTITVAADCCAATPAERHTWGGVRLRYR